jgi:hypothetical protein
MKHGPGDKKMIRLIDNANTTETTTKIVGQIQEIQKSFNSQGTRVLLDTELVKRL